MKTSLKVAVVNSETSNFQIAVKDVTGTQNIVNKTGYGIDNSFFEADIIKYIFIVTNLVTEEEHKYTFSPDDNTSRSLGEIAYGETVLLYPTNDCEKFDDGIYSIQVFAVSDIHFEGQFYPETEVVNNFPSAEIFSRFFDGLIVENDSNHIYLLDSAIDDTLTLDRHVKANFGVKTFYGLLEYSTEFIIDNTIQEQLMNKIGDIVIDDDCNKSIVSELSEVNLYLWASRNLHKKGDIRGAFEYMQLASSLIRTCGSC